MDFMMEQERLRAFSGKIRMPERMRAELIRDCKALAEGRERRRSHLLTKRVVVMAVVSVCLSCTAVGAAAYHGYFRDTTRFDGAVTGTVYEQATNEMAVSVLSTGEADGAGTVQSGAITVLAEAVDPSAAPYSQCDALGIGEYAIVDEAGNQVAGGTQADVADMAAFADGRAEMTISAGALEEGEYRLVIESFVAGAKGDQPLVIRGEWSIPFSV